MVDLGRVDVGWRARDRYCVRVVVVCDVRLCGKQGWRVFVSYKKVKVGRQSSVGSFDVNDDDASHAVAKRFRRSNGLRRKCGELLGWGG